MSEKTQHEELDAAFRKTMFAKYGHSTWEAERARLIREQREREQRELQHAADLAEAERQRQEAIAEQQKLAPGIPSPGAGDGVYLALDPITGELVRV